MKFHDTLNDKIWDLNTEDLIPEVKEKLEEIAEAFIEFLEIPTDAVLNKVITGSSASYNYNEFSDLDLHIIVDYDKVHEDCPLVNGYLNSLKKQFNDNHDIFIHGVPVELYAEQKDQGTVHNGLYSLQTGWIDKPKKIPPTDNDAAVEAKYNEIKELVDKCDDSEEAAELLEKIYNMRKAGLAEAGEFCTENLTFKKLRNEGCMDKLRQLKKEKIDKQLSLENFSKLKNKLNKSLNERRNKMKKLESMNEEDYNKSIFSKLDKLINEAIDGDPQTDEGSIIQKGKTIKGFPWTMTKIDEVSVDILGVTLKYNIVKFHVDMPEEEKTKWDNDRIEYKIVDRNVFDQLEKTITDLIHAELGDNVINDSGRNISIPMEGHIK